MKHLIILFILSCTSFGYSQTIEKKDKVIYYDENWNSTSETDASYMRIIKNYSADVTHFELIDYRISGEKYMEGRYLDPNLQTRDGQFIWYYKNGKKRKQVNYSKGNETGSYATYYSNGSLRLAGEYKTFTAGDESTSEETILTFYDSLGVKKVENGRGYYYECYGGLNYCASGTIKNGLKNGQWSGYDSLVNLAYRESYKNGKLIYGESTDKDGKKYTYRMVLRGPIISSGEKLLYSFIAENIKYPHNARVNNIKGVVYVQFTVSESGALLRCETIKGIDPACDEEAVRVIKAVPYTWSPALRRGKETSQSIILPVRFSLR